jgi:hypothetical protein
MDRVYILYGTRLDFNEDLEPTLCGWTTLAVYASERAAREAKGIWETQEIYDGGVGFTDFKIESYLVKKEGTE